VEIKLKDRARQSMVDRGTDELKQCNYYIGVYREKRNYTK